MTVVLGDAAGTAAGVDIAHPVTAAMTARAKAIDLAEFMASPPSRAGAIDDCHREQWRCHGTAISPSPDVSGLRIAHNEGVTLKGRQTMQDRLLGSVVALALLATTVTACATVGGSAVGAGAGAAVGAGTGYGAGKGALIGAGVGAAAGAIYDITKKN